MSDTAPIGIIGGTGTRASFADFARESVATPFGPIVAYGGELSGRRVLFLPRHGREHDVLPHEVNYRGNVWALHHLGVEQILALSACGSLRLEIPPGQIVSLVDFIDLTKTRISTFRASQGLPRDAQFYHVDLQPPYCSRLRDSLKSASEDMGDESLRDVVYACVEGPRFESPSEIRMIGSLGADVVGMTGLPEAILARELGICYASIGIVTNYASGLSNSPLEHEQFEVQAGAAADRAVDLITREIPSLHLSSGCCPASVRRARWFGAGSTGPT